MLQSKLLSLLKQNDCSLHGSSSSLRKMPKLAAANITTKCHWLYIVFASALLSLMYYGRLNLQVCLMVLLRSLSAPVGACELSHRQWCAMAGSFIGCFRLAT